MNKKHKNTEDCETTQEFPEWGLYTNFTDIPRIYQFTHCFTLQTRDYDVIFDFLMIQHY